jgi:hypothetical protein
VKKSKQIETLVKKLDKSINDKIKEIQMQFNSKSDHTGGKGVTVNG